MLTIYPVIVGPLETNCYLVTNASREALIVDPGADPETIAATIEREKLQPVAILMTHGHYDHVLAVPELLRRYAVPVFFPEKDRYVVSAQQAEGIIPQAFAIPGAQYYADTLAIPGFSVQVIHTPGHTAGQSCFLIEQNLFSGDMLFAGGYLGRTDLWGGSESAIRQSLKKLLQLPDVVKVFPGHGPASTIGEERGYYV